MDGKDAGQQALTLVGDGQLVRSAPVDRPWQLVPKNGRRSLKVAWFATGTLVVAAILSIPILFRGAGGFWWFFWSFGKGGFIGAAAFGAGLARLATRLTGWQLRRIAGGEARLAALRGRREGAVVRVVGKVRAPRPFRAPYSGEPAVVTRVRVTHDEPQSTPLDTTHAIDFDVELPGGGGVHVRAADIYLTDLPEPLAPGSRAAESRVGPGDTVEVIGVLEREIDPAGESLGGRELPQREVLQGSDRVPLLVRRRSPA